MADSQVFVVNGANGAHIPLLLVELTGGKYAVAVAVQAEGDSSPFDLTKVGGTAITLGQKAKAAALPVTLSSDEDIVKAEDAVHSSGDKGIQSLGVRKDTPAALAGADGDYQPAIFDSAGRLWARGPGDDPTNNRVMVQPKSSAGSGGPCTNADITMHSGACTLNRMIGSCTTGGTIAISDATGAAGTAIVTFTFAAGDEIYFDFGGLAFGTGIFFDITTFVGSVMVCVGPAVA